MTENNTHVRLTSPECGWMFLRGDRNLRIQLDIETTGLDPSKDQILMIGIKHDKKYTILTGDEPKILEAFVSFFQQNQGYAQLEGHNIVDFDLYFLQERAKTHNIALKIGINGGELRVSELRAAKGLYSYMKYPYRDAKIPGLTICDTLREIRYMVEVHLCDRPTGGYGLKNILSEWGFLVELEYEDVAVLLQQRYTDHPDVIKYLMQDLDGTEWLSDLLMENV